MAKAVAKPKPNRKQTLDQKAASIAALRDRAGRVTPKALVAAARAQGHPYHNDFDWDDDRCAQRDRERTAAELIRQVRFIIEYEDRKIAVPYYVSDPRESSSAYISTERAAKNGAVSERILRDELDRITAAVKRAIGLASAFGLKSSFERLLEQAVEIENRLADADNGDDARA